MTLPLILAVAYVVAIILLILGPGRFWQSYRPHKPGRWAKRRERAGLPSIRLDRP